ncbi:LysR family transcriptional regulator, partial [Streptomyces sp. WELS2]
MLDVRRLRILHHLAIHGTVAAAAEALHLTAPAVSQQLAVLEREAGLPVVEKHGRT